MKDKLVKIALDSRKLNEACVKRKFAMPNMDELISRISARLPRLTVKFGYQKDLDYAYGQAKIVQSSTTVCFSIVGGDFAGH